MSRTTKIAGATSKLKKGYFGMKVISEKGEQQILVHEHEVQLQQRTCITRF